VFVELLNTCLPAGRELLNDEHFALLSAGCASQRKFNSKNEADNQRK